MASATDKTVSVSFDPNATSKQSDIIAGATTNKAGVMTAAQVQALGLGVATEPVDLYVDATLGNDANPGTQAQPLKTVDEAYRRLPVAVKNVGPNKITFAAGNYPLGTTDYRGPIQYGETEETTFVLQGAQADQLGGMQTADPASTNVAYVCTGPVVADGSLRGATLYNRTNGRSCMITGNTTTAGVLTINLLVGIPVSPGDEFEVMRPATVFQVRQFDPSAFIGNVDIQDIKFESIAEPGFPASMVIFPLDAFIHCRNVEFDCGTSGRDVSTLHRARLSGPAPGLDRRAGFYIHAASPLNPGSLSVTDRTALDGFIVADNTFIAIDSLCKSLPLAIDATNTEVLLVGASYVGIAGKFDGGLGFLPGVVSVVVGSSLELIGDLDISNAPADGLFCDGCNFVIDGGVTLSGTGNGGFGINLQNASSANLTASGGAATITGAGGDVLVGAVPTAYGALPFAEVAPWGPTGNRAF